jgi:redox-sensitive bicupin YhaK (pirin superfamily)
MGNERSLSRGQVQYMSAGTGVLHSELNKTGENLRFLQIWIMPDKDGYPPNYGDYRFRMEDRFGKWLPIATGDAPSAAPSAAPIKIHQDINAFAAVIPAGEELEFALASGRQAYFTQIEGRADITSAGKTITLAMRDAAEITDENFIVRSVEESHVLVIEMAKPSV